MLVEDNADDEALTLRALEDSRVPCEVHVVRDGVEALDRLLRDNARLPALVLVDLKLPKLDGLEVLQRLRASPRTKSLCVVIFTSSCERQDVVRAHELGCNAFVTKPVSYEQYVEAVAVLGRFWLRLNEPLSMTRERQ